MSIFIRIWFFFGLIILLGLWFMSYTFNQQVKPNVRQVVEDTLAENANIIAMLVAEDVYENKVGTAQFDEKIQMRSIEKSTPIFGNIIRMKSINKFISLIKKA